MAKYTYLIVGGGMTADAAVRGIREIDPDGSIGVLTTEAELPYNRPPLSKGLWKGEALDSIWCRTPEAGVVFHRECTARALDLPSKTVTAEGGAAFSFDKLLLATGGDARRLSTASQKILYFRTLADYRKLRSWSESQERICVLGGGFIGSEIAAALTLNKKRVTLLFAETGIGGRIFPEELSLFLNDYYRRKGVEVLTRQTVSATEEHEGVLTIRLGQGTLSVNALVAGIGISPNVGLAKDARLAVENGIVIDEFLRTAHPDVYAAGDVAAFFNPALGQRVRFEHEDNARHMGILAGRNMAGSRDKYDHIPFFYSDLFDLGYEAVGLIDNRLEVFCDWKEKFHVGVIYYLDRRRVRGVLLWNVWGQLDAARALLAEPGPFQAANLQGRIPA
ncbi:NAD(P)/FAD-dependent oxidoreductase [Methylacidimicrobium tartarophylax]|uniref:3-phenylpropionate/trans-cinnamate dioxygenase ferredoxin reductase component n=1 Tax=Methylacidimicrobium tartarophylax TaxID=1041768 RepID=A0A5E6MIR9_9BACT|nr:FAD/NAD(P)-binding oxidoreductase [Methylacidimicrobium tartarophylax]VVM08238.1 3-phenylpropionate/trans-cinnamate dioxygenase ferredoxin reductase component [Methylacidimicrobium tartarophylax]